MTAAAFTGHRCLRTGLPVRSLVLLKNVKVSAHEGVNTTKREDSTKTKALIVVKVELLLI